MTRRTTAVSAYACALALLYAAQAHAQAAPAAEAASPPHDAEPIIVTGTRASGITQAKSPTPIKVLDASSLAKVGQPNLNQILTQLPRRRSAAIPPISR